MPPCWTRSELQRPRGSRDHESGLRTVVSLDDLQVADRRAFADRHGACVFIGTASRASLNMVERFFRDISENRIKRDSFTTVPDLERAIRQYIEHHNKSPKPFIWTVTADAILAKVTRAKAALAHVGR
jgi:hypothetical protein